MANKLQNIHVPHAEADYSKRTTKNVRCWTPTFLPHVCVSCVSFVFYASYAFSSYLFSFSFSLLHQTSERKRKYLNYDSLGT